jgi:hypothetical protein
MSTAILGGLSLTQASARARIRKGFVPPAYALRATTAPSDLPKDELGRELTLLLWSHPEIAQKLGSVDVRSLSADAKRSTLDAAREMLGIKPLRRQRLGYVGD